MENNRVAVRTRDITLVWVLLSSQSEHNHGETK